MLIAYIFAQGLSIVFSASHVNQINGRWKAMETPTKVFKKYFTCYQTLFKCIDYKSKERYTCTRRYIISYNLLT